jgi:DNA-binding GntR family transcriptional regulator
LADETLLLMTELSVLGSMLQDPIGDHRLIVERVSERNAPAAVAVLVRHLEAACDYMVTLREERRTLEA